MDSSEEYVTPPEISELAKNAMQNLLPRKSIPTYSAAYDNFMKWRESKKVFSLSEEVLLAYFNELSTKWKPSTLWSHYSMLRSKLSLENDVDISGYNKLIAFLEKKKKGFRGKQAKVFSDAEIEKFLTEAPDSEHLATKVILIFGVLGGTRCHELPHILVNDVKREGNVFVVQVNQTKTNVPRSFTIQGEFKKIVDNYIDLCPPEIPAQRFFVNCQEGRCTVQPIGINKFSKTPKLVANYLKLENPESYTGHGMRRTSATLLANSGVDILTLKRHGAWKSSAVAERYIAESTEHKKKTAKNITAKINLPSTSSSTNVEERKIGKEDTVLQRQSTIQWKIRKMWSKSGLFQNPTSLLQ